MADLTLEKLPDKLESHWSSSEAKEVGEEYLKHTREWLTRGDLPDFELANAVFMASRHDLSLIVYQTAAKERIRWLSVQLAAALQKIAALEEEIEEARSVAQDRRFD